jgi:hypothetical protein
MKSSLHSLIPSLPSLLSHLPLPSQRGSLNYYSAGLGSSLRSLGADRTGNTVSISIARQYLVCRLFIRCRGDLFTESLPISECLLWLRFFGFQASCHCAIVMTFCWYVCVRIRYVEVTYSCVSVYKPCRSVTRCSVYCLCRVKYINIYMLFNT